jgi:hypothetical protein
MPAHDAIEQRAKQDSLSLLLFAALRLIERRCGRLERADQGGIKLGG